MALIFSTFRGIDTAMIAPQVRAAVSAGVDGFFIEFGGLDAKGYPVLGEFILASVAASAPTILIAHYQGRPVDERIASAVACGADIISICATFASPEIQEKVSALNVLSCMSLSDSIDSKLLSGSDLLLLSPELLKRESLPSHSSLGAREPFPQAILKLPQEITSRLQFYVFDYFLHPQAIREYSATRLDKGLIVGSPLAKVFPDGLHIRRDESLRERIFDSIGASAPMARLTDTATPR